MIAQPCKNQEKPNRDIENKFAGVRDIFKRLSRTVAIGPRIIYPYRLLLFPNKKTLVFSVYHPSNAFIFRGVAYPPDELHVPGNSRYRISFYLNIYLLSPRGIQRY